MKGPGDKVGLVLYENESGAVGMWESLSLCWHLLGVLVEIYLALMVRAKAILWVDLCLFLELW